ncbi:hypothetical protein GN956_G20099 [Arapaima gigas]
MLADLRRVDLNTGEYQLRFSGRLRNQHKKETHKSEIPSQGERRDTAPLGSADTVTVCEPLCALRVS